MTPFKHILTFIVAACLVSSCVKDEVEISDGNFGLEPEIGVPLAFASIEAERIIDNFDENGIVESGADGSLSLIYIDTLDALTTDDLLDLPDQLYTEEIDLSDLEVLDAVDFGTITITQSEFYSFESHENDRLDSIRFESGNFHLEIDGSCTYPMSGTVRIYSADNTVAFSTSFEDVAPPLQVISDSEMTNVLFKLSNNEGNSNAVRFEYELTFTDEDDAQAGDINFEIAMEDFSIRSTGGFIAPRAFSLDQQTVHIHMFDQSTSGTFSLADPRLHLHFRNGFGLELGLEIAQLTGINADGGTIVVDGENIENFQNIAGADFLGDIAESSHTLSNDMMSPNLTEFMEFSPKTVNADLNLIVNPSSNGSSFVSNTSEMDVSFEAEIPIYGSISDFHLIDTTDVSLGDFVEDANEMGEVESLELILFVNNGLPIDAGVQIIFLDDDYQPVAALFNTEDLIFESAPVNTGVSENDPTYGLATGKTPTRTSVSIERNAIEIFENVSNMIIHVFGNTANNGDHPIRLTANDNFDVHLAGKTKLSFNND